MDDRRFPPSQDPPPTYTGEWSFDSLFPPSPTHHPQQQQQQPPYAEPHTRHRSRSLSTLQHHIPYVPPETMPSTSQLDLLATLAQNPTFASPPQPGAEADFNHALVEALRMLAANVSAAQAANSHAPPPPPHHHQQQSHYLPGSHPLPPSLLLPHTAQYQIPTDLNSRPPPIDPLTYWIQQNADINTQSQGSASNAGMQTPGAGPSRLPDPQGQPTTRGRARSNAGRRGAASAPVSPVQGPPSPPQPPIDPDDPVAVEEDKRRRNTAASARFRAKKKQHVNNLEMTISDLTSRADELEREASDLRRENGWLKEIVMLKGRAMSGQALPPPQPPRDKDKYLDGSQGA